MCFAVSNEVDSCTLAGVSISLSSSLKNEKMILNVVQCFFWKKYVGSDNIIRKYSQNSDQFQQVVYLNFDALKDLLPLMLGVYVGYIGQNHGHNGWSSTDFFFYPPITANLDFDIVFDKPKLSEQTLPHQWRSFDQSGVWMQMFKELTEYNNYPWPLAWFSYKHSMLKKGALNLGLHNTFYATI